MGTISSEMLTISRFPSGKFTKGDVVRINFPYWCEIITTDKTGAFRTVNRDSRPFLIWETGVEIQGKPVVRAVVIALESELYPLVSNNPKLFNSNINGLGQLAQFQSRLLLIMPTADYQTR